MMHMHEHPTSVVEALATREMRYAGKSEAELAADARGDMLRLLNVYSDVECPGMEEIQAMYLLARGVARLGGHHTAGWEAHFPEIAHALAAHCEAMDAFFLCKAHGHDASAHIGPMFEAHARLAGLVKAMCVTEAEKAAIMAAVKK